MISELRLFLGDLKHHHGVLIREEATGMLNGVLAQKLILAVLVRRVPVPR